MEEYLPSKWKAKKAGVAILVADKTYFKPAKTKETKKGIMQQRREQCDKKS